jgi:hypothetical protein
MGAIAETIRALRTCLDNVASLRAMGAPRHLIDWQEQQARDYKLALDRLLARR